MNVYTHIVFDDAEEELKRMEEFKKAQAEPQMEENALMWLVIGGYSIILERSLLL